MGTESSPMRNRWMTSALQINRLPETIDCEVIALDRL